VRVNISREQKLIPIAIKGRENTTTEVGKLEERSLKRKETVDA
jgi:hypothetical protein